MSSAAVLAVLLFAGSALLCGVTTWRSRTDRPAAALLVLAGALSAVASGLGVHGSPGERPLLMVVVAVVLPATLFTHPRPPRDPLGRALAVIGVVAGVVLVVSSRGAPGSEVAGYVVVATLMLAGWWTYERGDRSERRALLWVVVSLVLVSTASGLALFLTERSDVVLVAAAISAITLPPAIALGVLRPELVDVRGIAVGITVALVTLVLFLSVASGLAATFAMLAGRPLTPTALVLVCAVVGFGVHPVQDVMRGIVDALLFGDRPDPLRAASLLVDRVGAEPEPALHAVRQALVLPYAALVVDGDLVAASGTPVAHTRRLGLPGGDGELVVGLRPGELRLAAADEDVLRIVAALLAQALRSEALARDLQASRGSAIAAIEEERRRLRRDLHDGLGPTLTGVAFAADAARNQLTGNPAAADALLERLRADTTDAIDEVRRLVEGLRPPALDQLGLVGAVRVHAAGMHGTRGAGLVVDVEAGDIPDLPAGAEVAAYRIVVEALTNVARHARATHARVELAMTEAGLRLVVEDDGAGDAGWVPGVGLSSMRERAEQVGGTVSAGPGPRGGLVVAGIPV